VIPANSADPAVARMTFWPHTGTNEWVQYDFDTPLTVKGVKVYWFDDKPGGGCALPKAWNVQYKEGDEWKDVSAQGEYGCNKDTFNTVGFKPVTTDALRLNIQLQENESAGILEWELVQ